MAKTKPASAIPNLWHVCIAWPNGENSADTFATTVEANSYDEAVKACVEEMHFSAHGDDPDVELDYDHYDSPIDCYPLHEGIVRDLAEYGINMTFPQIIAALTKQLPIPLAPDDSRCIKVSPEEFILRLESSASVKLPGVGEVKVSTSRAQGLDDNKVAFFMWVIAGETCIRWMTERNIRSGSMQADGSFRGCDVGGAPILVMFRDKDDKPLPQELRLAALAAPQQVSP